MDGDVRYKNLLKFAITKKSAKDVTVILIIDMSRPWTIVDTLNSWVHVLREHIHSLNLSPKELNEMEHNSKWVKDTVGEIVSCKTILVSLANHGCNMLAGLPRPFLGPGNNPPPPPESEGRVHV